jgi:hypothetical protein
MAKYEKRPGKRSLSDLVLVVLKAARIVERSL